MCEINIVTLFTNFMTFMYKYLCEIQVDPIKGDEFEVMDHGIQEVVDIRRKTCFCRIWQLDNFSCCHAITSLWKSNLSPSAYVSEYYTKKAYIATYAECIYLSGLSLFADEHVVLDFELPILPPEERTRPGRPKKSRFPSVGEHASKSSHCGSCNKAGHNKRTFSNESVLSIQQEPKRKSTQLY